MANGEQFSFSYTDPEGVKRQVYCLPFEDSDIPWYFLLSVRQQVFTEQNQTFLTLSLILLGSVLLIVAATVYVFYDSRSRIDEARAEARARSSFLSNMSHDIRTPLNGIIGLIYLMKKDIERGDTISIDKRLDKEAETAQYLLSLVNNILDISKLEDGKVELNNAAVSPEMIVDAIWSMQKSTIEGRGIHFVLEKEIIEPWVMGDDVLIKRILMNIVGNSAKFTPAEGTITLALRQRPVDANHVDTIFVCSDTGCGMSKKFLDHLWDRFSQERNDATPAGTGTGLGMAISKLLVDAMGGEIDVTSELGKGSTFTVTLHTKIATETPTVVLAAQPATDALQPDDGRPIRLLVAEDNELNAELLIEILESEGFEVEHAADGRQAVDKFQDSAVGAFDAILMDMQMPILDGCEASAQIRALDRADAKTVTIFACTANSFQEDREHALSVGMNDFITKPIDVHALLKKLTERQIGTQHGARTEARF
jgi:signal transduction histidine kinase/ActR/RegA family two-component response regulator